MNIIIGTAGHVDHGKTELIKALTGKDTDRLHEEKERGISIVLGFAPLKLTDELNVGVVDVPGHERFVKTMVSGAVGVDMALLVVAADEGVMPQTEEHMEVLRLLGVRYGVVAITKTDLAEEDLAGLVEEETRELTKGTFLEGAPLVRTSVVTGEGIEELRRALTDVALSVEKLRSGDFFRMPVDRVFIRQGIGTIVTGTTWSGEVKKGDELLVEPVHRKVRVREVQSFDRTLDAATPGLRTALALHGIKKEEMELGYQLVSPGVLEPANMIDASIEVSNLKGAGIKNRQRVRFHHAANEILARVITLEGDALGPGEKGFVQLRLERPAVAMRGDRFVIRSYSPMRVIAGGTILDPVAIKARPKFFGEIVNHLRILEGGSSEEIVTEAAERERQHGIGRTDLIRLGIGSSEIDGIVSTLEAARKIASVGGRVFAESFIAEKVEEAVRLVSDFTAANRLSWGMEREELRSRLEIEFVPLLELIVERGINEGRMFAKDSLIRTGGGDRDLSAEDSAMLRDIENALEAAEYEFLSEEDLKDRVKATGDVRHYLKMLEEEEKAVRIIPGCYMHRSFYEKMLEKVKELLKNKDTMNVAEFKGLFSLSRKFAVPLLEHLDSKRYTVRVGNERKAGPAAGG